MNGYLNLHVLFSVIWLCILAMISGEILAEEAASKKENGSEIGNIGFMGKTPNALREKFPMCDAFLKIDWIDKKKMIGYSHYEAIVKNEENQFQGERKPIWALVDLKSRTIHWDVSDYERQGRLKEIFEAVKHGETQPLPERFVGEWYWEILHEGKQFELHLSKAVNEGSTFPLLSDYRQTVCIPYPDGKRMWIIEGKTVGQTYSEAQIAELSRQVNILAGQPVQRSRIESHWILDLNKDGQDDFIYEKSIIYTVSGVLYQATWTYEHPYHQFTFPPGKAICRMTQGKLDYRLTTDGRNYYREGCNLTELTKVRE